MRYLRIAWCAAALAVLAYVVLPPVPVGGDERGIALVYAMLLITFPSGVVAVLVIGAGAIILPHGLGGLWSGRAGLIASWLVFVSCGYLQWFVAVPRVWEAIVAQHRNGPYSTAGRE